MGMAQSTAPELEAMEITQYMFVEVALGVRGLSMETVTKVAELESGIRFIRGCNTRLRRLRVSIKLCDRGVPHLLNTLIAHLWPRFLLPKLDSIETWQQWKNEGGSL